MNITFQYTPQVLQQAHEIHYKKFFQFQSRLPLILGFMAGWAGLLLLLILGKEGNKFLSISLIFSGVIAIIIYFWMLKTIGKRVYKKIPQYHDPFMIAINDQLILMTIHGETFELPWESIKKAVVTNNNVLLYPTDRMFYIFPKRNFSNNEFEEFEELVRNKVPAIF